MGRLRDLITCPSCKKEFFANKRSNPQNDRYWGLLIPAICEVTGYFPEEAHIKMKEKFNAKDSVAEPGKKFGATTTNLTTKQFAAYCDQVEMWASIFLGVDCDKGNRQETG